MAITSDKDFMARYKARQAQLAQAEIARKYDRTEIAQKIKERVIGQDAIADTIAAFIAVKANGHAIAQSEGLPVNGTLANILISGPSGTGKSELAKAVSEALFGSEGLMLQIDCGNVGTDPNNLAALVGSPSVYSNSSRGSIYDYLVKFKGQGVILFDEFEKAAPNQDAPLAKMMLKLMDEGKMQTPYDMSTATAHGCIIILTSNLKQKELADAASRITNPAALRKECGRILAESMAPEFIGRLNLIATTSPLSNEDTARIVKLHFDKLATQYGIQVVDYEEGFFDLIHQGTKEIAESGIRQTTRFWLVQVCGEAFMEAKAKQRWRQVIADFDGLQLVLTKAKE